MRAPSTSRRICPWRNVFPVFILSQEYAATCIFIHGSEQRVKSFLKLFLGDGRLLPRKGENRAHAAFAAPDMTYTGFSHPGIQPINIRLPPLHPNLLPTSCFQ